MKQVALVIFLFLAISVVVNGQLPSDAATTLKKINDFVCKNPGLKNIPEKAFHKFVHCADSAQQIINCRISTFKSNLYTKAEYGQVCQSATAQDVQTFSKCVNSGLRKAYKNPNAILKDIQNCETTALGVK